MQAVVQVEFQGVVGGSDMSANVAGAHSCVF